MSEGASSGYSRPYLHLSMHPHHPPDRKPYPPSSSTMEQPHYPLPTHDPRMYQLPHPVPHRDAYQPPVGMYSPSPHQHHPHHHPHHSPQQSLAQYPRPHHMAVSPGGGRKRRVSEPESSPALPPPPPPPYVSAGENRYAAHVPLTAGAAVHGSFPRSKKARTNTPWTPEEEQRLRICRQKGSTWSEIAKVFPNRTEGSVKKHWYKDMHYADFGQAEHEALLVAIKDYEANKWKHIGGKLGKPAKACEQYAKEHFASVMKML